MSASVTLLALAIHAVACRPFFTQQGPGHDPDPIKTPPLKLPDGAIPLDHHGTYSDVRDGLKVKVHYGVDDTGVHTEFVEPLEENGIGTNTGRYGGNGVDAESPTAMGFEGIISQGYAGPQEDLGYQGGVGYQGNVGGPIASETDADLASLERSLQSGQAAVVVNDAGGLLSAGSGIMIPNNLHNTNPDDVLSAIENGAPIKVVAYDQVDKYLKKKK